jgi:DNA transformation protein and related proteins
MSVSDSYKAFILEQLQDAGTITARRMFGGIGLYLEGTFFGLIDDDVLYFKVDDTTRGDFERWGSRPFRPYGEDSYSMQYYEVPADVLEDRSSLKEWTGKAVAVARKSATARRKKKPRSRDR